MFAAKYNTHSIAQIFTIAGKDLSKPIKTEATKDKTPALGLTEEKVYEYLKTIGISKRKTSEPKSIGLVYTKYSEIPQSDVTPLYKKFDPTFLEILWNDPKHRDINPVKALT